MSIHSFLEAHARRHRRGTRAPASRQLCLLIRQGDLSSQIEALQAIRASCTAQLIPLESELAEIDRQLAAQTCGATP